MTVREILTRYEIRISELEKENSKLKKEMKKLTVEKIRAERKLKSLLRRIGEPEEKVDEPVSEPVVEQVEEKPEETIFSDSSEEELPKKSTRKKKTVKE